MVVPVKKKKGTVSNVPRKKKHKGKIKENLHLLFQLPNGVLEGSYKKKVKGMGNNVPKKKNIKKR